LNWLIQIQQEIKKLTFSNGSFNFGLAEKSMILKWVTTMFDLGHIFLDQLCPTHWATCSIVKDFVQLYFVFTVI